MTKSRKVFKKRLDNKLTNQIAEKHKKNINSFDIYENKRQKKIIPGQRLTGRNRNIAKAREMAIEKRSKTLFVEYKERDKTNIFHDSRFGETDPSMSIEEKMLKRFQQQKKKESKKRVFNLEEEGDDLTHYGQKLTQNYDFEKNPDESESDDENGGFSRLESQAHFRDSADPNRPKTHKEIMMEIIQKSKEKKDEKRRENEENDEIIFKLDNELNDIRSLLTFRKDVEHVEVDNSDIKEYNQYDIDTKILLTETKAKATDRKKTPEERAKEAIEKLQKLETDRVKRMHGEIETETTVKRRKGRKEIVMEDPEIDEEDENEEVEENALEDETEDSDNQPGEEKEDDDDNEEEDDKDNETEDKNKQGKSSGIKNSHPDHPKTKDSIRLQRKLVMNDAANEMPYIMTCPNSLDEFYSLCEQYVQNENSLNDLIQRIHTCTNINLSNDNKGKMMNFYNNLIQYCRDICMNLKENPLSSNFIIIITKNLIEIGEEYNSCPKTIFMKLLLSINLKLDKLISGSFTPKKATLSLSDLIIFKLVIDIFPVTDFNHPIISSSILLLCREITECQITSVCDLITILYSMSLLLQFVRETHRIIPELFFVLDSICRLLFDNKTIRDSRLKNNESINWFKPNNKSKQTSLLIPLSYIDNIELSKPNQNMIYFSFFNILLDAFEIYNDNVCIIEYFTPFLQVMCPITSVNQTLRDKFNEVISTISGQLNNSCTIRKPLSFQTEARKAQEIRSFEPKYEEEYMPGKKYDANQERLIEKQLKKQQRSERKGAARELRKDSEYLAMVKEKERREKTEEEDKKRKRDRTFLEEQQRDAKQMSKKKHAKGSGKQPVNNIQN